MLFSWQWLLIDSKQWLYSALDSDRKSILSIHSFPLTWTYGYSEIIELQANLKYWESYTFLCVANLGFFTHKNYQMRWKQVVTEREILPVIEKKLKEIQIQYF